MMLDREEDGGAALAGWLGCANSTGPPEMTASVPREPFKQMYVCAYSRELAMQSVDDSQRRHSEPVRDIIEMDMHRVRNLEMFDAIHKYMQVYM